MPVKVTCNPADLAEISDAVEMLDLTVELDWRMKPGLVRLAVYTDDAEILPFRHRGYERRRW